jgi:hypothetical protein
MIVLKGENGRPDSFKCLNRKCPNKGIHVCGKCKVVRYCSKECQEFDWKNHKPLCYQDDPNYKPLFADEIFYGHNRDDLIIVYSSYEDIPMNKEDRLALFKGRFFPQWFLTNCTDGRNAGYQPTGKDSPSLCSFQQMAAFGKMIVSKRSLGEDDGVNVKNVRFFYSPKILLIHENHPFPKFKGAEAVTKDNKEVINESSNNEK